MMMDVTELPAGKILQADLCIVGAGAAGITIAKELAGTEYKVFLLESGGMKFDHRTQSLYKAKNIGREYQSLEFTKRRQFGGSTVTWFGRCRPLDAFDFETRSWVPHSGWPITNSDLDPFYLRAREYCQLISADYDVNNDFFDDDTLETKRFYFSPPTNFGDSYKEDLERARNIEVILNANVVHIGLNEGGTKVQTVTCKTLGGKSILVQAKVFVLAASALENTRLLLASRDVHKDGIGNQHDLVGRFFMEHPHFFSGTAESIPNGLPPAYTRLNYELKQKNLVQVDALGLKPEVMNREGLLNACAFLVERPAHKAGDLFHSQAVTGAIKVMEVLQHSAPLDAAIFKTVAQALTSPHVMLSYMNEVRQSRQIQGRKFVLRLQIETAPNPQSRVKLSEEKDSLGVPKLSVDWKTSSLDIDSIQRFEHILFDRLQKRGMRVRKIVHDRDADGWPVSMHPGKHHMGTTRMRKSETQGVVDEHCRVHGVANLYIAGGSVFPTSGMANPTLTIVALAIRAADHIKSLPPSSF